MVRAESISGSAQSGIGGGVIEDESRRSTASIMVRIEMVMPSICLSELCWIIGILNPSGARIGDRFRHSRPENASLRPLPKPLNPNILARSIDEGDG